MNQRSCIAARSLVPAVLVSSCLTVTSAGTGGVIHKLTPSGAGNYSEFGTSVAVSGNIIVTGAPIAQTPTLYTGAAYMHEAHTGIQLARFLPNDLGESDEFGQAVAVEGQTALIGAPLHFTDGVRSGAAYLYSTLSGGLIAKILPGYSPDPTLFGHDVAVDAGTAVVGAPADREDGIGLTGSVYIFDATTGEQRHRIVPDDGYHEQWFGSSVAVSGDTLLAGAILDDEAASNAGAVYVFDASTAQQLAKIHAPDAEEFDSFGMTIAMDGHHAVIGSNNGSGSVYLYDLDTFTFLKKFVPDAIEIESFGSSLALSDGVALIGADGSNFNGDNSGAALLISMWYNIDPVVLLAPEGEPHDNFGCATAIGSGWAIVGALRDGENGAAFVFDAALDLPLCATADLSEPFGLLDIADIYLFTTSMLAGDPGLPPFHVPAAMRV